jgi:type I restriction enzyme S subunit
MCFIPRNPEEDLRYWAYYLGSSGFSARLQRVAIGSTNSHTRASPSEVIRWEVPNPPVPQKRLISQILDTLDTTIRRTEAIIEKLKQVKQGLLHDLLTRGIDANGELRPPQSQAPHLYKDSPLGWIPQEWEASALLNKIDLPTGQIDPRLPPYCDWVLIAPDHIESATGRLLAAVSARDQAAISGKYLCAPGDVIYSKIRPYLRKATLASEHSLCSADMYPFTPHDDVNSQFLLALLLGEAFSRFAESVSMRTGMPKINREELAECVVAWPSRCEQDRIVAALNGAESRLQAEIYEGEKLMELKSGLMDDLLTGRVRVTPLLDIAART